jgi:hypothetical protein
MAQEINITAAEDGAAGFTNGRIKITLNSKREEKRDKGCSVILSCRLRREKRMKIK